MINLIMNGKIKTCVLFHHIYYIRILSIHMEKENITSTVTTVEQ